MLTLWLFCMHIFITNHHNKWSSFLASHIRILLGLPQIFFECEKVACRNKIWCVVTVDFANQFQSERSLWHNCEGLVQSVLNQIRWICSELKTLHCATVFESFSLQERTSEGRIVPKGRVPDVLEVFQLHLLPHCLLPTLLSQCLLPDINAYKFPLHLSQWVNYLGRSSVISDVSQDFYG